MKPDDVLKLVRIRVGQHPPEVKSVLEGPAVNDPDEIPVEDLPRFPLPVGR